MPHLIRDLNEGIVDFGSRRAIVRVTQRDGRLAGRARRFGFRSPPAAGYILFDDTSISAWDEGRWTEPSVMFQPGVPRLPLGLGFLDLLSSGRLAIVAEHGRELVHGLPAERYEITLDVDHIPWPEPGVYSGKHRPRLVRLTRRIAPPKSMQRGVIPAEVWLDGHGRLARFSYSDVSKEHRNHDAVPWRTIELWGFGLPTEIEDWRSEPDPSTLKDAFEA